MTIRFLAAAVLLALAPVLAHTASSEESPQHETTPATTLTPATPAGLVPVSAPTDPPPLGRHRFFFANAQRESLTGAANARRRMRAMVDRITRSHADLGVLVELEGSQPATFRAATRHTWGLIAGATAVRDAVIYRSDTWTVVERRIVRTSWNHGTRQLTPVVVLADPSGARVGVIPVHNPHDSGRRSAINNRRILAAVHDLQRRGIPVLVAGDFNSGRPAMCRYTRRPARMRSASHPRLDPCHSGPDARIDQAFATPDLRLLDYHEVPSRATDHRYVYAVSFEQP